MLLPSLLSRLQCAPMTSKKTSFRRVSDTSQQESGGKPQFLCVFECLCMQNPSATALWKQVVYVLFVKHIYTVYSCVLDKQILCLSTLACSAFGNQGGMLQNLPMLSPKCQVWEQMRAITESDCAVVAEKMLLISFMANHKYLFTIYENRYLKRLNCSAETIIRRQVRPSFTDSETILILFNGLFLSLCSSLLFLRKANLA